MIVPSLSCEKYSVVGVKWRNQKGGRFPHRVLDALAAEEACDLLVSRGCKT
jgi:hypothetical protein